MADPEPSTHGKLYNLRTTEGKLTAQLTTSEERARKILQQSGNNNIWVKELVYSNEKRKYDLVAFEEDVTPDEIRKQKVNTPTFGIQILADKYAIRTEAGKGVSSPRR